VSDKTNAGLQPRWRLFVAPEIRYVAAVASLIAIVGILAGGYLYGRYLASRDMRGRNVTIAELRAESQRQKRKIDDQSGQLTQMQIKLEAVQAQLDSIRPSANTYNIEPNQTLIVGDGHLAIGMVGAPGNESVTLTINGRQQAVTVGQLINVAPDPATNCKVAVQSFDMFKAVLNASCAGAKAP